MTFRPFVEVVAAISESAAWRETSGWPRPMVADAEALKPGLRELNEAAGLFKVAGSARAPLNEMVKLDHLYVSNWTLWSDVKIPLRTAPCVFGSAGCSRLDAS